MLVGSVLGLTVLSAAGVWVYGVYRMSDPATSVLVGIRIDGSRISVKTPTCPTEKVGTVEVYDSDSEMLLWRADHPKTAEGKHGVVTLWKAGDFFKASPGTQPRTLPTNLDVSVTYAGGEDGTGDVFNLRKVQAAHIPTGQYWTDDGPMTAAQIDAQLNCNKGTSTPTTKPKTDGKEPTG
ncbi:hypothetical protein [Streptomyces europaeiscabiei]|uniref:hypothetical protein n=1 Tax=Streptomyces europaeiscabiei TaxID=146819 RepID=UPI002E186FEE